LARRYRGEKWAAIKRKNKKTEEDGNRIARRDDNSLLTQQKKKMELGTNTPQGAGWKTT